MNDKISQSFTKHPFCVENYCRWCGCHYWQRSKLHQGEDEQQTNQKGKSVVSRMEISGWWGKSRSRAGGGGEHITLCKDSFSFLESRKGARETERERESSVSSHFNDCKKQGWSQEYVLVLLHTCRVPITWAICCCFLRHIRRELDQNWTAGTWTVTHRHCQWLYPLCHSAGIALLGMVRENSQEDNI